MNDTKLGYLLSKKRALEKAYSGKIAGKEDATAEEKLLKYINEITAGGAV